MIAIRIPFDVTISYVALGNWKQSVGMPLSGEFKPEYKGKAIAIAYFSTEADAIMFKLKFGV
jgi:hypothetical protein